MAQILKDIRAITNPYIRLLVLLPVAGLIALYTHGIIVEDKVQKKIDLRILNLREDTRLARRETLEHDSLCREEQLKIMRFYNDEKQKRIDKQDSVLSILIKKK